MIRFVIGVVLKFSSCVVVSKGLMVGKMYFFEFGEDLYKCFSDCSFKFFFLEGD